MKKFLAIVLAAMMLVSLVACGGGNETKDDGKIENFPTLTYLYNTSEGHKAIGEYLQAALAEAGITMKLENQEWNTFLETRKNGDYSIARNGWLADYNDPICFLDMWTSNSGNNDVQYGKGAHANLAMYNLDLTKWGYDVKVENGTWAETYDVLIATIKSCTDATKRYEMMHLAEDILMETGCIVPLYFYTDLYMVDDALKGFFSNPLGSKYFMNSTLEGKDYINVCLSSEPATLDPALNSAVDGATMAAHLFSGLAKWSQDADGNLQIVADLANNTKDIYVDGVLCGEGLGLCSSASTAASFKVDLTRIMQFDQSNGEGGTMYVDDFKSYKGNESQASNVISCDFDSFTAGPITNDNKDMGVVNFSIGSNVSMAIVEDGNNKYASTSSTTASTEGRFFDFITSSAAGNDITIEGKFKLGKYDGNDVAICGDLIKLLDPSSTTIALVRLDADGTLKDFVYSGTSKSPSIGNSLGVKLSETEWTTIKVVCHMNENTKDIYINGNLVVKDSALYNTNGAASYETAKTRVMHFKSSGIGTLYVDDFTFTK